MFFFQPMLRRSALLTPMLALGLAASPVHSTPSETSLDPLTVLSWDARTDTNTTFNVTINGVQYVSDQAGAGAVPGWPGEPNHHYFVGHNVGGPDMTPMSFELRFTDNSEHAVDRIYFFDNHKNNKTDLLVHYGKREVAMYSPTGGYLELKFSPDRTWVEGKFAFNATRNDGANDIAVEGTFSMRNGE
ncbi:hypothetical protein IM816_09730 [Luteibacter flocculans]|uniref:Uncharacterized protein n=1 Tax=Luteibacter flocculans TaxID=2780091 RepID=A0ABY4T1Z8_9GAMM|nr:hypothetical protein [Luteibacter flocculans]URL56949.1 hypothetical protein IM816_09730 [Luteibacter flocculans]